ncbi:GerAB/ArcD/ProY family transporter [Tumebacillus sp. DT12]|uniref:GerAB/ArcD/ProY family transporter n=1 Tax=Tumebacillus lacus TaxID=2995335 RepID=A0ABT3X1C4_9BACL|nr:GerAB/ArcD/ProY family transporter [Tumebacillus lacus]MCX7569572.1 GerAB/ArcD/ProY family transporter [Tumebacillus lacus]
MNDLPKQAKNDHSLRSIDFIQTLFFVQTVQVGIGLFNLPRIVSEEAGHDGWISILLAGGLSQISMVVIVVLLRRFHNCDLYAIMTHVFGKWIGRLFGGLFALYAVCVAAIVSRTYIEIVQSWLFPTTSTLVFFLLFVVPLLYCATGGPRVLGQFAVVTFFATFWLMLFLITPGLQIETTFYQPLFEAPIGDLVRGLWKVSASVVGFELLLVIYPYVQRKNKVMLASSIGIWFTTFIYLIVTLVAIGFYSQEQIKDMISPTLHMFKVVQIPIIERVEHIGIATWSFLIVNTAGSYLWAAGRYLYTYGRWSEKRCIYLVVPLLILLGVFPQDVFVLVSFEYYLGLIGGTVSLALPALLLICAIVLKKKGEPPQPGDSEPKEEATA